MGEKRAAFVHEIKLGVFHCGFPGKFDNVMAHDPPRNLLFRVTDLLQGTGYLFRMC